MQDLGLKKQRKVGTMEDAVRIQWRTIKALEVVMYKAGEMGNIGSVISAGHAITQANQGFAKLFETAELQKQINDANAKIEELRSGTKLRKVI